jgi:hypothetical protein
VWLAAFSAPSQADDFLFLIDSNVTFQRINQFDATTKIRNGECIGGQPFRITQSEFLIITKKGYARRIQKRLQDQGANAFVITNVEPGFHIKSVDVTPLRCSVLR